MSDKIDAVIASMGWDLDPQEWADMRRLCEAAIAQQPAPAAPDGFLLVTPEQVEQHATTAWECTPLSRVVPVSTLKRLHAENTATPAAEQPKCITCRDSGIVGHSDVCPACAETWTPAAEQPGAAMRALATISRMARNEACRSGVPAAGQLCTWDAIADMADAALAAPPAAEQQDHHVKLLGQALGECIAAAGITRPGAALTGPELLMFAEDLKGLLAAEQPDTVKVPRVLLAELRAFTLEYDSGRAGVMRGHIDALLGKEGEA